ncbi:hypothetical protein DRJ16_06760 [Candidatus Woesearchaeota archaeon]|nr:MAG: hypothetical protein DRJ16_06760 [Candidatus Woesearchaeota archaeon]
MDVFGAGGIVAVVIPFIVQLIKKAGLPKRFAPLVALLIGAACGAGSQMLGLVDMSMIQAVLAGIAVGGTSTGLYDLSKITVMGK